MADFNEIPKIMKENIQSVKRKILVPIHDSLGRIAAEDFITPEDLPRFSHSLVDGYAVIDKQIHWEIVAESRLTETINNLNPNQTAYIPTGGIIPANTLKMIKVEYTNQKNNRIYLLPDINFDELPPEFIEKGFDYQTGEVIIEKGETISYRHITILAAFGKSQIWVNDKPRISIVVTGQEILPIGAKYEFGKVYDSTSSLIIAFLKHLGVDVVQRIMTSEELSSIRAGISSVLPQSDIILTTGGTSMGKHDNVYRVMQRDGEIIFHGVNVRPGKPMLFSKINGIPVLSFPGFVTSTIIMCSIFLPTVITLLTQKPVNPIQTQEITLGEDCSGFPGWYRLLTGKIIDNEFFSTFKTSSSISSFAKADGYIIIPPESQNSIPAGTKTKFYRI